MDSCAFVYEHMRLKEVSEKTYENEISVVGLYP